MRKKDRAVCSYGIERKAVIIFEGLGMDCSEKRGGQNKNKGHSFGINEH